MRVSALLFVDQRGSLRMTRRDSSAYPSELAVHLVLDVPDKFFDRPIPQVKLDIPESYLIDPDSKVVANWVAPDVAGALKLDVKRVEDGLKAMLDEKLQGEGRNG